MRYYIIAGEASGDLHGSNLIREIRKKDPQADVRCWGGDKMQAAGATLVKHYKDLAFMGFIEVVKNLPMVLRNIRFCKKDIAAYKPDCIIFIDYPGFNLRIAEWARNAGYKTVYYISPQVWAWKEGRVHSMKENIDLMLVILPFEKDYFKGKDWDVVYTGHPLLQVVDEFIEEKNESPVPETIKNAGTIALLPGSRRQEISVKLPLMLTAVKHFPEYSFVVAKAPGIEDEFYNSFLEGHKNVYALSGKTYDLLYKSKAALVTSGTATLETALFAVPEIVCYKGSPVSYQIAKRLIKVPYISLVNLIMGREVVKELIQNELNEKNIVTELRALLEDNNRRQSLLSDYAELRKKLYTGHNASEKAADEIMQFLHHGSAQRPHKHDDQGHQKQQN